MPFNGHGAVPLLRTSAQEGGLGGDPGFGLIRARHRIGGAHPPAAVLVARTYRARHPTFSCGLGQLDFGITATDRSGQAVSELPATRRKL